MYGFKSLQNLIQKIRFLLFLEVKTKSNQIHINKILLPDEIMSKNQNYVNSAISSSKNYVSLLPKTSLKLDHYEEVANFLSFEILLLVDLCLKKKAKVTLVKENKGSLLKRLTCFLCCSSPIQNVA